MRPKNVRMVVWLFMLFAAPMARAATPDQCGDADRNGSRTVTDGVLVLRTAAELTGGCSVASRCDIDGSRSITVTDGVAALRLAAGLPVQVACPSRVDDFSAFGLFDYSYGLSFGFCPEIGAPTRILLDTTQGGVVLSATVLVEGTAGDPDCLPDVMPLPPAPCVKTMGLPSRVLTADEETRVRNAFAAITVEQQRNPDCGRVPIEPCLLRQFQWDTFLITDFACGEPRLPPDQAAAVVALLESLL